MGWEDDSCLDVAAFGESSMVWDSAGYWMEYVTYKQPMRRGIAEARYKTRDTEKD